MMPGIAKMKNQIATAGIDDKIIKRQVAVIDSMTRQERKNPDILKASRKKRIAAGAGLKVEEVNKLLKMHRNMADMMKAMGSGQARPDGRHRAGDGLWRRRHAVARADEGDGGEDAGRRRPAACPRCRRIFPWACAPGLPNLPGLTGLSGKPTLPGLGGFPGLGRRNNRDQFTQHESNRHSKENSNVSRYPPRPRRHQEASGLSRRRRRLALSRAMAASSSVSAISIRCCRRTTSPG